MKNFVLKFWNKLSDEWKKKIVSGLNTFGTTFVVAVAINIVSADQILWSWAFWGSLATVGIREGIKALIAPFLPVKLGGRKV